MDRYETFVELTDTWVVFDAAGGVPAELDGDPLVSLTRGQAAEAIARLKARAERGQENVVEGVTIKVRIIKTSVTSSAWDRIIHSVS